MINRQEHAPLMEALMAFKKEKPISFHVPGHKNGRIFQEQGRDIFDHILKVDATEVEGLDDLHAPEGAIREAEQLLSDVYGTQKSYFLVNGTTCGNLAMILGNCKEGDIVLVQRNCHKSILNGLRLAKVKPIFLRNELNEEWGVAEGLSVRTVKKALSRYNGVKAIILTYPTYYGTANEIEEIIAIAHEHEVTVLVDEAHGAHFIAGTPFPKSSLTYGADYVVHSAHKTLPAMTMGSYLHVHRRVSDYHQVEMYLHMLQSSSPSYPIMASLDLARVFLGTITKQDLNYCSVMADKFKTKLSEIEGIKVLQHDRAETDLLKLVLQTDGSFTGFQLQKMLNQHHLYSELADPKNVLFILPLLKDNADYPFDEAVQIIKSSVSQLRGNGQLEEPLRIENEIEDITELKISFKEMEIRNKKIVPLKNAANCIAAETIIPYPPGIPYIMDGEMITEGKLAYLQQIIEMDVHFHGGLYLKDRQILIYE